MLLVLLAAVATLLPAQAADTDRIRVPDISRIDASVSAGDRVARDGRNIYHELRRVLPVVDDPELALWLRTLGNRITQYLPDARYPFYFSIINDLSINAFATRGGVVAVNAGLILNVDSEDELAAVMAHELAHVSQHHIERLEAKSATGGVLTGLGILATIIAAAYDPTVAQAALMSTVAFQGQQQLAYSRQMETEADRIGLKILTEAGYDPSAMATFLSKLEGFNPGGDDEVIAWLRTHPLSRQRVANVIDLAGKLPHGQRNRNPAFLYAREKLRALLANNRGDYPIPELDDPEVRQYAKAWSLANALRYDEAIKLLRDVHSMSATLAKARWLNETRRYDDTIKLLQPMIDLYAHSEPIAMLMTEALLGAGQAEEAWSVIAKVPVMEQNTLGFYDLKARAADASGRRAEGFRALAQKALRTGATGQARSLLKRALKEPGISEIQRSRLEYEISQIEEEDEG